MHFLESIRIVVSAILQWMFILAAATSPIALNVWAWQRLRRPPVPDSAKPWSRRAACIGLVSNFCGYMLPSAAFIRNFTLMNSGRPVYAEQFVDWELILKVVAALFVLSLALGATAPKYVRFQLMASPLLPFLFWISLPVGV